MWLNAFEAGYREGLIPKIAPNLSKITQMEIKETANNSIRPATETQAVFYASCIYGSESFRRHLEAVGDYAAFAFAGFFTVFIRYRALGSHLRHGSVSGDP